MVNNSQFIDKIVGRFGQERKYLLPILQEIIKSEHYLTEESLKNIAKKMAISAAEVYGVASFYSFLDMQPRGENIIRICKTITCFMKGKDEIIRTIEKRLKVKLGETTPDHCFSFLLTNCIGWCHKGPAMLINDKVYTEITPEKAVKALDEYLLKEN